jgi:hypothetical protein
VWRHFDVQFQAEIFVFPTAGVVGVRDFVFDAVFDDAAIMPPLRPMRAGAGVEEHKRQRGEVKLRRPTGDQNRSAIVREMKIGHAVCDTRSAGVESSSVGIWQKADRQEIVASHRGVFGCGLMIGCESISQNCAIFNQFRRRLLRQQYFEIAEHLPIFGQ